MAYNKAATDSEGTIWFDVGRSQWVTTQEVVDEDAGGDIEWSGSGIFQYPTYSDGGINADMIRQAASDMYTSVSDDQINTIMAVAEHESGNNSNKINNWDKNAQEGHPSKGVLQFVGYTFDHYHVANHDNIWSSMDQLYALFNDATWASDISLGGWAPNGPVRFPA
ncbi:hypothetical protein [Agrilactobacillus composti]|uniref:hypothetical protein n=1 Tax=Agrilactobacillus composti TaxID=398555 RepID=UPI000554673F|nr:hypothetical protein [Agrilactobacillus composti]